jgi:hypothetical protein
MAGVDRVKGDSFQSLREQVGEDERLRMRRMAHLPAGAGERQRLMSMHRDARPARQIAALRHPLTDRVMFAPISGRVTDALKESISPPRISPFDRLGIACLAWASIFIVLTAVLAVTLK